MRFLAFLALLIGTVQAQTVSIPAQTACSTIPAQTVCVTLPARTLPVTAGTPTPPPPTCAPPQVLVNGVCTTPTPPPPSSGVTVTGLPLGWRVAFAPVAGAINYVATDLNQHWLSSAAGSPHVQSQPPIFAQGVSGASSTASATFTVFAQTSSGAWNQVGQANGPTQIGGSVPAWTDPFWIYNAGVFNGSCDFSQLGGDPNALLPQFGGTGKPSGANDVDIAWWDTGTAGVSGPQSIRVKSPVADNFSPCFLGTTLDLIGHPYTYWTVAIRPDYVNADFTLVFEGNNDLVVSNQVTLSGFVTAPAAGHFTANAWNRVNVPMTALKVTNGVYKTIIQQPYSQSGIWHVDALGFSNSPQ